jgi:hypothetical protein
MNMYPLMINLLKNYLFQLLLLLIILYSAQTYPCIALLLTIMFLYIIISINEYEIIQEFEKVNALKNNGYTL